MSNRICIGDEQAKNIRARLELLVQKGGPPLGRTARAVIEENRGLIRRLRDLGYSWEAVAEELRQEGMALSANTVRQYVSVSSSKRPADRQGTAVADGGGCPTKAEARAREFTLEFIKNGASRPEAEKALQKKEYPALPEHVLRELVTEMYGGPGRAVEQWLEGR